MLSRRMLLVAGITAGTAALIGKPRDAGAPHSQYFAGLNQMLLEHGVGKPALILDLDRLDQNIDLLVNNLAEDKKYRIVCKSLPSLDLIGYIMKRAGTNRLMAFHQPFLNQLARQFPDADVLMGKPLPINAVKQFYASHEPANAGDARGFVPSQQLQWLVDSNERLGKHLELARSLGQTMQISLEIDIGLHRGGFTSLEEFKKALETIQGNPSQLKLSGLMGYDAHVGKIPAIVESAQTSLEKSLRRYQEFINTISEVLPDLDPGQLTLNGAGSRTILLHRDNSWLNDLAAGSCLLKPVDFDVKVLEKFETASFIATPVIKKLEGTSLPGAEFLSSVISVWDANREVSYFIYGGNWQAEYQSPTGLVKNPLYGKSSNQEIVNSSHKTALAPGEFVFLRPTQSEAVLLQFGSLLGYRKKEIVSQWPILNNETG